MQLGNGFKQGKEYLFKVSKNGLYKLVEAENNKVVYKTYNYKEFINYFDNVLER